MLAIAPRAQTLVSDDFNGPLNTGVWTFVDPVGDASLTMTGTQASISIPASAANHNIWVEGNRAPRLMQPAANGDFEIEAKFDSPQPELHQYQGILVQADAQNFMRIDFLNDGSSSGNMLFIATLTEGASSIKAYASTGMSGSGYLRVMRSTDTWTVSYSENGTQWTQGASFTHALNVSSVGIYCANFDPNPAHTTLIDYFHAAGTASEAPSITTQPSFQTVTEGTAATFSVAASGTSPLSYQWRKDGVDLSGGTSSSYTLPSASVADNGARYSVVITNSAGTITSSEALLTVNAPPTITAQPSAHTVTAGQTATFSVTATGTAPLSYQWKKGGLDIPGATASTYTTPVAVEADNGSLFSVAISNVAGSATSAEALLTVNPAPVPPTITAQPSSRTVTAGQVATFNVTAAGTAPLSYQWQRNGESIPGANSATFTSAPALLSDDGAEFTVVVSNSQGAITSSAAILEVGMIPTRQLVSLTAELFDAHNNPVGMVTPQNLDATVKLYTVPVAGTPVYTEHFLAENGHAVSVSKGMLTLRLGSGISSQDLRRVVAGNSSLYAEFVIGPTGAQEIIQPRTPVTSPFLAGTPRFYEGAADPTSDDPIGTYYLNTTTGGVWLRSPVSWIRISP